MSHPSRPRARNQKRIKSGYTVEAVNLLEERQLLTPIVTLGAPTVTTATAGANTTITANHTFAQTGALGSAGSTSVSLLTPSTEFGGDMVRIEAGPGGDFGKGVYAISRGAPAYPSTGITPVNRPGVIYRVDPATGKSSVFFDLNTVVPQLPVSPPEQTPPADAANDLLSVATGLHNWYDLNFDLEGQFDGRPSLFISSVDEKNPQLNAIYRVAPDGSFLGLFSQSVAGLAAGRLEANPTAILVPPPEQQAALRGMVVGEGTTGETLPFVTQSQPRGDFTALFFDANQYRPGQRIEDKAILPDGVSDTKLTFGPQTAIISTNDDYLLAGINSNGVLSGAPVVATFTDFGLPPANPGGSPFLVGRPGLSGIQKFNGDLLINGGVNNNNYANPDQSAAIITPYRRFQDAAFDKYGYFSQAQTLDTAGALGAQTYVGSVFVADLAAGGSVTITPPNFGDINGDGTADTLVPTGTATIQIPLTGSGVATVTPIVGPNQIPGTLPFVLLGFRVNFAPSGDQLGGRVVRVDPAGVITPFAEGFNVGKNPNQYTDGNLLTVTFNVNQTANGTGTVVAGSELRFSEVSALTANSFVQDNLSTTFSADGTTFYTSDLDGIWQFKTTTSLANSSTGQLIGLSDLRSLGVPYEGQDSAVAVIDSGVDANTTQFRGRVAQGINILTGAKGNDDLASGAGHGTPVAGVVSQFVPEATILPVNTFLPNAAPDPAEANAPTTTANAIFQAMGYVSQNPFVNDPIRPNKQDRVIASTVGFGTTETFTTEAEAFRFFPQIIASFKNQAKKLRDLGIATFTSAGQNGVEINSGTVGSATSPGSVDGMSLPAVLSEMISVSGSYSFPYDLTDVTTPNDPAVGVHPRPSGPRNIFDETGTIFDAGLVNLVTPDAASPLYKDRILGAVNRNSTTDFVAPALDVPTFSRVISNNLVDLNRVITNQGGTSLSMAIATGSYAVVASALDYWTEIRSTGFTADGYLNTPIGTRTLDYGKDTLKDLSIYASPDGINSILQWTAVPANDNNDGTSTANPPELLRQVPGRGPKGIDNSSPGYRNYSRVDIGNAIAAIEGSIALDYLIRNDTFKVIDSNNNGLVTATELQTFVDRSVTIGMPEAGAMARLLGGNARIPDGQNSRTALGEQPDEPDVLQRRFNFFDYVADGQRNGSIAIDQLDLLVHKLLPTPDAFSVVDRPRSSGNGFLVDPAANRNYQNLQRLSPKFVSIPASQIKKFKNISPAQFGVGRGTTNLNTRPFFTLQQNGNTGPVKARSNIRVNPNAAATAAATAKAGVATTVASTPASSSSSATKAVGGDSKTSDAGIGSTNTTSSTSTTTTTPTNASGGVNATPSTTTTTISPVINTGGTPVASASASSTKETASPQQALIDALKQVVASNQGNAASASATATASAGSSTKTASPSGTVGVAAGSADTTDASTTTSTNASSTQVTPAVPLTPATPIAAQVVIAPSSTTTNAAAATAATTAATTGAGTTNILTPPVTVATSNPVTANTVGTTTSTTTPAPATSSLVETTTSAQAELAQNTTPTPTTTVNAPLTRRQQIAEERRLRYQSARQDMANLSQPGERLRRFRELNQSLIADGIQPIRPQPKPEKWTSQVFGKTIGGWLDNLF